MSINTLPATFEGQNLDIIIIGNERWAMGAQIGHSLGYTMGAHAIGKIYKRNRSEFGLDDTMVVELPDALGRDQLTRLYSAKGIAKLAMFANTPKAAAFRDWAAAVLTTPRSEPELLLTQPVIGKTALNELTSFWLRHKPNRKFLKYAGMPLSDSEVALLCGWKARSTVTKTRRAAEVLGLIPTQNRMPPRLLPHYSRLKVRAS